METALLMTPVRQPSKRDAFNSSTQSPEKTKQVNKITPLQQTSEKQNVSKSLAEKQHVSKSWAKSSKKKRLMDIASTSMLPLRPETSCFRNHPLSQRELIHGWW